MRQPLSPRALIRDAFGEKDAVEARASLESFAALAALAPPATPSFALRARLMEAAARPRYAYLHRAAALLDLGIEAVRALLDSLDDERVFAPTEVPGVRIFDIAGGPAVAGAVIGFIRVEPGAHFPHHSHVGREEVLVLQGAFRDLSGHVFRAGDFAPLPAGSAHEFDALPGEVLVYLGIVHEAVDFSSWGGPIVRG